MDDPPRVQFFDPFKNVYISKLNVLLNFDYNSNKLIIQWKFIQAKVIVCVNGTDSIVEHSSIFTYNM